MELRSGRRLRRSSPPPPPPPHDCFSRPSTDLISSLPDEMLLLVLARLRCARTAVQTSLLSRRWRGLWMGLTDLTFRGLEPTKIEALFRRFGASTQVSTLDISLPQNDATTGANSLLRAVVRLSPGHLVFTLQGPFPGGYIVELPCFPCTTSIELEARHFWVKPPRAGEFTALDSLSVTGTINNLGSLLNRCPRLRVLSVTYPDKYILALPPAREFPMLQKLSLSGQIVDPGPLLNSCERLRELSITQAGDTCLTLPPSGEFPVLEKLSLSGNIAELGTLLNRCPRLRVLGVTFSGMAFGSLEAALTTLEEAAPRLGLVLSLLGIGVTWTDGVDATRLASILGAASRLSPQELVFTDNFEHCNFYKITTDLPSFPHATSIKVSLQNVCFTPLPAARFSMLERLSLSGRSIVDIGTLVTNCPRLRVLEVTVASGKISVHSASLQKLVVLTRDFYSACEGIDIVTPGLKELHLDVHAYEDIDVSISAPAVEKLTLQRRYTVAWGHVLRPRLLHSMAVETIERSYVDNREDTCWRLPRLHHVLSFHLNPGNNLDSELNFAEEMEKLPVTNFSVLELNFKLAWHVYGALVSQVLRIHHIRDATKKLKVVLPSCPKAKQPCSKDCPCDRPKNWRIQSILCGSLEEVEISGFNGEDHEHDFLILIFKCSPMLKRLSVTLAQTFGGCTKKLTKIFLAHPSVNCYGHFSSGKLVPRASG